MEGAERNIDRRIGSVHQSLTVKCIWTLANITRETKLQLFTTDMKIVLSYVSETRKESKGCFAKFQALLNR